jgi:hypothetical protein
MHKIRTNYSSCTAQSNENLCTVAAVEELTKRKWQDEIQFCEFEPPLNANVLFFASF